MLQWARPEGKAQVLSCNVRVGTDNASMDTNFRRAQVIYIVDLVVKGGLTVKMVVVEEMAGYHVHPQHCHTHM